MIRVFMRIELDAFALQKLFKGIWIGYAAKQKGRINVFGDGEALSSFGINRNRFSVIKILKCDMLMIAWTDFFNKVALDQRRKYFWCFGDHDDMGALFCHLAFPEFSNG